jgi:HAD superfamily hydrolase (TIGR01509 family)
MIIDEAVLLIIDRLHEAGISVGLLSNSPTTLHDALAAHRLHSYFDVVLTSEQAGYSKPDPKIFSQVLDMLGVSPQKAWFFDDRPRNVQGAYRCGLHAYQYKNATSLLRQLHHDQLLMTPRVSYHF